MSMIARKRVSLGEKNNFLVAAFFLFLILCIVSSLTNVDFEDILSNGINAIIGLIGLYILVEFKNKTLTFGWATYLSGLLVDLLDEVTELPVWLDKYYEDAAYGVGLFVIVIAFYAIVKEKQQVEDYLRGALNKDALTGLYNHGYFYRYFQETAIASDRLILLFCDLDYFKTINDLYGHIAGDRVLTEIAHIINQTIGNKGTSFRYGGEEFAVLLKDCDLKQAVKSAQELISKINSNESLQKYAVFFPVTLSIGLAVYPQNAKNAQELIEKADKAMYCSKQKGGNQLCIYDSEIDRLFEQDNLNGVKRKMLINSVFSLATAIDAKDNYTGRHSELVTKYALQIADNLRIPEQDKFRLRLGAILHDCGKIGIPDEIINKPGELSDREFEAVKNHSQLGYDIVKHIIDDTEIMSCVLNHHERWDGRGYPQGLTGTDIPLFARIISIADAFHAMTSDRPYREALSFSSALEELKKCAGSQFDPALVSHFLDIQSAENVSHSGKYLAS